jgi:hypothetical protein
VGEPVHVPIPDFAALSEPKLVAISESDFAVVFEGDFNGQPYIASFAVREPFVSWPPSTGVVDATIMPLGRWAASEGELPGAFGFAAFQSTSSLIVGTDEAGASGVSSIQYAAGGDSVHALARNQLGQYVVGAGGDGFLSLYGVEQLTSKLELQSLGVAGCASPRVLASATPSADSFLVASAVDTPFDDCLDPDLPGPATVAQVHRVDVSGAMVAGDYVQRDAALAELMITERPGGAWLGLRDEGSTNFGVYQVSEAGTFAGPHYQDVAASERTHALAAIGPTFALASLLPSDVQPGGELTLTVVMDFAPVSLTIEPAGSIFPLRGPALATSTEARSLLVAFVESDQPTASMVVWRADCFDAVE